MYIWTTQERLGQLVPLATKDGESTINLMGRRWFLMEDGECYCYLPIHDLTAIDGSIPASLQELATRISIRSLPLRMRRRETGKYKYKDVKAELLFNGEKNTWESTLPTEGAYMLSLACDNFQSAWEFLRLLIEGKIWPEVSYETDQIKPKRH